MVILGEQVEIVKNMMSLKLRIQVMGSSHIIVHYKL